MDRPWMKFHTRDWLDNKELRRCSRQAIATLADLMCLAHEGTPYGYLCDKTGPLTEEFMASRCIIPILQFRKDVKELLSSGRLEEEEGRFFVGRMVKDEGTRIRRAAGGALSGGNPKLANEGYPSVAKEGVPKLKIDSRARMRAESDSDSSSVFSSEFSLQEPFDWFKSVFVGEFPATTWREFPKYVGTAELLEKLRNNTPLWMLTAKYAGGFGKDAIWFLRSGVWHNPPAAQLIANNSPNGTMTEAERLYRSDPDKWTEDGYPRMIMK